MGKEGNFPSYKTAPLDGLIPYARNSRTHSDEQVAQIAASIREFGFTNPVLVDGEGGIIAGHGRVMAARKLGMKEVPVIELAHLTDAQKRAYVIADNALALKSGWNDEMLRLELADLEAEGFDVTLTGFSMDEIAALEPVQLTEGLIDEDEAPALRQISLSRLGDIWVCGKHRVMCGDSTSQTDMDALTSGQAVDMWLTDPPYNVAYEGKTKEALKIKNAQCRTTTSAASCATPTSPQTR